MNEYFLSGFIKKAEDQYAANNERVKNYMDSTISRKKWKGTGIGAGIGTGTGLLLGLGQGMHKIKGGHLVSAGIGALTGSVAGHIEGRRAAKRQLAGEAFLTRNREALAKRFGPDPHLTGIEKAWHGLPQ